jgi:hypothetical protein
MLFSPIPSLSVDQDLHPELPVMLDNVHVGHAAHRRFAQEMDIGDPV